MDSSYVLLVPQQRNFSAMNPIVTENASKKHDKARGKPYHTITKFWHFVLSMKSKESP